MPNNHASEKKQSKCTKKWAFSKIYKFLSANRKIVQLNMEHDVWQPIFDQPS